MVLSCVMTRKTKLLSALRRELRISDGLVRRLKPLDAFRVNGKSAHTNQILVPGDRVTVTIEEAAPDFPAQQGPLSILYEDDCLIALDKPLGILVHPTFSRQTGTLANYLLGHYQATGQACAVHVVTRLDRDTMGVVLFAKNAWAHWLLMEQLADGRLEKVYEALTLGGPEEEEGLIDLPIAKRPNPSLLRYVDPSGKPAQTRFRVLERGEICRLELRPLTGRTHQLRVHCAYMGFPIVGDPQYGGAQNAKCKMQSEGSGIRDQGPGDGETDSSTPLRCAQNDNTGGQRLVARRIGLEHPLTGERIMLVSQIVL
ncbi:MAG: RluA family pseudouridine synthase [Oscillospiraceae bacterium]|nr:RluA family pseudouridine synthase [Oscillospiraceae bacterium]